jgi:Ankyrin repeats (3 copies)/Ankyrin repeats (many copies)
MGVESMRRRGLFIVLGFLGLFTQTHAAPGQSGSTTPSIALAALATQCIEFGQVKVGPGPGPDADARECAVMDAGVIGAKAGQTFYFALYCLTPASAGPAENCQQRRERSPEYFTTDALAVFVQGGADPDLHPLFVRADAEIGMFNYGRPSLFSATGEELLLLPIQLTGTGGGNASELYRWDGLAWQQMDTQSWLAELKQRLPGDRQIWKGVWPNLRTLEAVVPLYQRNDANCCPTGGTALVELGVIGQRFNLNSVRIVSEQINPELNAAAFRRLRPEPAPPAVTLPVVNYPKLNYPVTMSSWMGNGFGVVAELGGNMQIEGDKARIRVEKLRLRQVTVCAPKCVTVTGVKLEIYADSDASHFATIATSQELVVNQTFEKSNGILDLGKTQFEITLPGGLDLTKVWLGLEIENADRGTYYTHSERNIFARALQASGNAGNPCEQINGIEHAIETRCNVVLEKELNKWYRPLAIWWDKLVGHWHPVTTAIHENNMEALQILVAHGVGVDEPDEAGTTTLMIAASNGNAELVKVLLKAGANVNYRIDRDTPQRGRGALTSAIYSGDGAIVEILLNAGAATNQADSHGWLPVHYAAYYANIDGLRALKGHNANLDANTTAGRGETPLMLAAQYGKLTAIKYLLSVGVNASLQDRSGKNAHDYAKFFNQHEAAALLRN